MQKMSSFGNLTFYGKNGLSDPYSLSYGKTTVGSSSNHHIRIRGDNQISCVLDTNEFGVTTLINEFENEIVCVNNVPTIKYTILKDGDHIEFGKKKFKYSNPSLKETYVEQTQQTLITKYGMSENLRTKLDISSKLPIQLKSFQAANSSKRRFSTGCKITEVKSSPKITKKTSILSSHTSTPQSATKVRFSQRMVARRNSTLASVKENEVYDFQNPVVNFVASPIPKKRASFLAGVESPLAKKNNTFAGSSKFTSPLPSKNKTYSGNISDVSDNVTTPENNVTAAAITPLNVSKKSKKSMNRSRTLSYVDFPDNSSTPKSAIKMNRSSSLYKPIVEDITPASPLPRSSLRNSSLKLPAFTQRRSVNVSSASDNDSFNLALEEETSLSGRKRSRDESSFDFPENAKRRRSSSFKGFDKDEHDQNSLHDSSLSGIHNLSDNSFNSNQNQNLSASNSLKDGHDLEDQSIVSWHEEMSHNDPTQCVDSAMTFASSISSRSRRSSVQKPRGKSNVRSKSLNLDRKISKSTDKHSKTLGGQLDSAHGVSLNDPTDCVETAMTFSSFISPRPRRSCAQVEKSDVRSKSLNFDRKINRSTGKHSKTLGDNLTLPDEEISSNELAEYAESSSSMSSRSRTLITKTKSNIRSKSLNLDRTKIESSDKHSKTLGNDLIPVSSDGESMSSLQPSLFDQSLESSDDNARQISSTPLVKTTSKSLCFKTKSSVFKTRSKSLIARRGLSVSSKTTNRASLNVSPIAVSSSVLRRSRNGSSRAPSASASKSREHSTLNSTKKLFGSLLDASLPDYNDSTNKLFETNKDSSAHTVNSLTPRRSTRVSKTQKSFSSKTSSLESDISIDNSTTTSVFKTPKRPSILESKSSSSFITSDNDSESLRVSKSVSFCDSSSVEDVALDINKSTPGKIFKSPRAKTPNKLAIAGTPSKPVSDPTDVRSMEKIFEKTLEKSPRKRVTSSNSLEKSLANLDDQESETSISESFKSVPAGKTTPHNMSITRGKKTPKNDSTEIAGVKTPQNDLTDVAGVRELLRTPRMRSSPKNDLSNVVGVKNIMATPKIPNSPRNDLTDVVGVKKLLRTPKAPQSPYNDLTNIRGVKKLLKTLKVQKSPQNDLTNIKGVKKLLKTPKVQKSPKNDLTSIKGVKKLLKTPKVQKSPRNDLTNVAGVKKLLRSPVVQKSPKNDLTNIKGVKKLMTTPKIQNSPKNDLTNVAGVKKLMSTPKEQKSPWNDLTQISGLKKLMASPKQQKTPENNLADVKGIKRIFKTPKAQKEPKNDLIDVRGIKQLLKTPKNKAADESHDLSGIDILFNESQENSFDKLRDKKPVRTYGKSPKINKSQEVHVEEVKTPEHVLKWLEDQSQIEHISPKEKVEVKRGKRKLAVASEVLEETSSSPNKKYKPTPKTRSADAKEDQNKSIELNLSCSGKPTSTPIIKKIDSLMTSKVETSVNKRQTRQKNVSKSEKVEIEPQTEVKLTRGRRKLQQVEKIENPPSPKRTRNKPEKNSTKVSEKLDESSPIPIEKKTTRSTRQAKKKDDSDEKIPDETNTRSLRGKKQIQVNDDNDKIEENEKILDETKTRSLRGKKQVQVNDDHDKIEENEKILDETKTRSLRGKKQIQVDDDNDKIEEKPTKRTRSKKETESENPPKEENQNIVNTRTRNNTRSKTNVSLNDEVEPNKKRKANKSEVDQDSKNIEDEPAPKRRGRKKKEEEENIKDSVSEVTKKSRGNKGKEIDEISAVIETETKTTRRGRNTKKEVEESNSITEKDSQSIKKAKTNTKDDTEKETSRNTRGKNQKKNQAKNEKDLSETTTQGEDDESTDDKVIVKKSTRSRKGKNQKYNEDEWDTPVKKKRLVNFNEDVEILQTPKEDSKTGVQKKG
ncbi:WASH complex subunit 2-like isoform X2 [Coccinella septempunctata]|uniref:WASH complex subunit 2-like isoform X2 n=1 Tax=Coccinella septempunctata TaxID=41139 RepID=UPI001D07E7AE|nr:WASH complex subunit 2-like isoform X2 [Coccinella septempunctata]